MSNSLASNQAELDRLERVVDAQFGPSHDDDAPPEFQMMDEGHYRLTYTDRGIVLDVDHLRRERRQLVGELAVQCDLPGARTFDGQLAIGDFNISSVRARGQAPTLHDHSQNHPHPDHQVLEEGK